MCKDEEATILRTLESILFADHLVIYDTGSTDRTLQIINEWVLKNNVLLHLKKGEFVDFSVSRNTMLEFANSIFEDAFLLLLDSNDEVRDYEYLEKHLKKASVYTQGFHLTQLWELPDGHMTKFWNVRCIRSNRGWFYEGGVHEVIYKMKPAKKKKNDDVYIDMLGKTYTSKQYDERVFIRGTEKECIHSQSKSYIPDIVEGVAIYHDRKKDMDKSFKRHHRDVVVLEKYLQKHPHDTRTQFYLAQSYSLIDDLEKAALMYEKRSMNPGYTEEQTLACVRRGDIAIARDEHWTIAEQWYRTAVLVGDKSEKVRVEPLTRLANLYLVKGFIESAYTIIDWACRVEKTEDTILFLEENVYKHWRYHLMSCIAYKMYLRTKQNRYLEVGYSNQKKASSQKQYTVNTDDSNLKMYKTLLKI